MLGASGLTEGDRTFSSKKEEDEKEGERADPPPWLQGRDGREDLVRPRCAYPKRAVSRAASTGKNKDIKVSSYRLTRVFPVS